MANEAPAAPAPAAGQAPATPKPGEKAPADKAKPGQNGAQEKNPAPTDTAEVVRKFKLKREDGSEEEHDEKSIIMWAQKARGLDKELFGLKKTVANAQKVMQLLKNDPEAALSHKDVGHDPFELAERIMMRRLDREKMSPEQRELADLKKQLQDAEEEKKRSVYEQEKKEFESARNYYAGEYEKEIISVLDSSGLPKHQGIVRRIAHYLAEGLKRGRVLKADQVVDIVRKDLISEQVELLSSLKGEKLLEILGEGVAKNLREADLNRLKVPMEPGRTPHAGELPEPTQEKREIMGTDDFRAKMEKILNR